MSSKKEKLIEKYPTIYNRTLNSDFDPYGDLCTDALVEKGELQGNIRALIKAVLQKIPDDVKEQHPEFIKNSIYLSTTKQGPRHPDDWMAGIFGQSLGEILYTYKDEKWCKALIAFVDENET